MKNKNFYLMAVAAAFVMSMNNSNAQLQAGLTLFPPFCAGTPVQIDATNGLATPHNYQELQINGIVMYSDTAASGSLPSNWTVYHTFIDSGNYNVQFIISDGSQWDTAVQNVYINPAASVIITATDSVICPGDSIMLTANVNAQSSIFWNDGQTGPTATVSPINSTSYSLWLFNDANNCEATDTIMISVLTVTASFTDSVVGLQVDFANTSVPDSVDSYWNFGDGSSSNDLNPIHTYATSGNYHVCLTIYDSVNCNVQDVYCADIQVGSGDTCFAAFSYFVQQVTEVVFLDSSQGATQWFWDFGDGTTSNIQNPVHQFPTTGFYTVSLTTYDTVNGCGDGVSALLTLGSTDSLADCQADFSYYVNNNNRKVWFTNQSLSGDSIVSALWNFGDGEVDTVWNPMHQYQMDGYYQVCLSITTVGGCNNISCQTILVGNPGTCSAKFIYTADVMTYQTFFTDVSVGITPTDWNWNFGDGGQSLLQNPVHTYSDSGTYHISMHIKDLPNGCNSHWNAIINLNPSVLIASGFVYTDNSSGKTSGGPYPINFYGAAFGDPAQLLWDFGDGSLDSTTWWPSHDYQVSGLYVACLTVSDPLRGSYSYCDTVVVEDTLTHVSSIHFANEGVQVYPNPSNGTVFVKLNEPCSVAVYNLLGEKILAEEYPKAGVANLHFNSGMYLLLIQAGDQLTTKKVLIR